MDNPSADPDIAEMHAALQVVLSDEATFQSVVQTVHKQIDTNGNGNFERDEMQAFLERFCLASGTSPPSSYQAQVVYQHLDLNGDGGVSNEELGVFLKHFFTEQLQQAREKLGMTDQMAAPETSCIKPSPPRNTSFAAARRA